MTRQAGQVFKLGEKNWGWRYRDTATGKRPQRSGYETKGDARAALNLRLERISGDGSFKAHATVREIRDAYLETYEAADRTVAWLTYHAAKAVDAFGDQHPDDITPEAFRRWRAGLSNKQSAHQTHRVFRQILAQALADGWIKTNVAARVKNPVPAAAEVETFADWPTVEAIALELGTGPDGGAILITGVGTGARPEELFGLNWSDVDLAGRTITLRRVYTRGVLSAEMKTSGSRRTIPLRARVVQALAALPERRGPVFHGARGARIDLDNWRMRFWEPAFEGAGLEYVKPYAWRHTYATWCLAAGINTFVLAKRMGTSLAMIDRTYGHLVKDSAEIERSLLDAWDVTGGFPTGMDTSGTFDALRMGETK
jgi:integrase